MLKINSNVPAAYVSPAVKWVNTRTRGMVCTSPMQTGASFNEQKPWITDDETGGWE